jgi:succinate dehydrogenase / fumarate reductase cytochrome b subunit
MSQTRADMQGDAKVRGGVRGPAMRPLSPHTQIWRWHVTMSASIMTRFSGIGLYGGFLIAAIWAVALASGPGAYADFLAIMGSVPGKVILFLLTLATWYHTAAGVRHLVFDAGRGYHPRTANQTAWAVIAFTVLASILTWVAAAQVGAL